MLSLDMLSAHVLLATLSDDLFPFEAFLFLGGAILVFLFVVLIVNAWLRYRSWRDDDFILGRIYTSRRMLWLYVKCWVVLMSGLILSSVFSWMQGFIPDSFLQLLSEFRLFFHLLCALLTATALVSIVRGETLAEVRLRKTQSENQLLKSQLNPHFLYNTLNNIDALIWLDQEKASEAVLNLSGLMRYFTYSARQSTVPLGEEISHLEQLVSLQRLRISSSVQPSPLSFVTAIDQPQTSIAPLLLLPLIENCFKHCGDLTQPGAISITITLSDGVLIYNSSNNLKTEAPSEPVSSKSQKGVGTRVLRQRLDLLYPHRYSLSSSLSDNRYQTTLRLELR